MEEPRKKLIPIQDRLVWELLHNAIDNGNNDIILEVNYDMSQHWARVPEDWVEYIPKYGWAIKESVLSELEENCKC